MKVDNLPKTMCGLKTQEILKSLYLPAQYQSSDVIDFTKIDIKDDVLPLIYIFAYKLNNKLNHKPSKIYEVVARSPIPYNIFPRGIRSKVLRARNKVREESFYDKFSLEEIRRQFLRSLSFKVDNKETIFFITHDVDSEKGFQRALKLKEIEEKCDVDSTWFLLTENYKLDKKMVMRLAENGEIASHGTKHSGRLYGINKEKAVVELQRSREELEIIVEKNIFGFRAPLLQYSRQLLDVIGNAGFVYDSSVPTWEPMHPSTMMADGVEIVNPIQVDNILEIPVTLPQDHQMLHILKLTPKQTIKRWLRMVEAIKKLEGIIVFLIHPDYEFANDENLKYYECLLNSIKNTRTLSNIYKRNLSYNTNIIQYPLGQ